MRRLQGECLRVSKSTRMYPQHSEHREIHRAYYLGLGFIV